jgi:hypothetical protein
MRVKITEPYATLVARDAYFWAWPLVNVYNRRLANEAVKEAEVGGPLQIGGRHREVGERRDT